MDSYIAETLAALERNAFNPVYAADIEAARACLLATIPVGATVGIGDSVSVRQLSVLEELQAKGRLLVDPFTMEISLLSTANQISEQQRWAMHKLAVNSEFYVTGTNALTRDGSLVNTDAGGNRVGGMIFGPRHVVIVVGRNKIVPDVDAALKRIKNVVAPQLCKIKGRRAPCVAAGTCVDCHTRERACHVTTILERAPTYTRFTVLLVDDDLGLAWDPAWPQERIDGIYAACDSLTWLKRRASQPGEG